MTAARIKSVPPWAQHLLVWAAIWTVFLGTGMGIVDPGFAASMPNHTHQTLNGIVPPHIDQPDGKNIGGIASCATTDKTQAGLSGTASAPLACGAGSDVAGGSASMLAAIGPVGLIHNTTFLLLSLRMALPRYTEPLALVFTPPPQR